VRTRVSAAPRSSVSLNSKVQAQDTLKIKKLKKSTWSGPGLAPAMYSQPSLQPTSVQAPQVYYNQLTYNSQFPQLKANMITTNHDLDMSNEESSKKHQWQTVSYKRRRMNSQTSAKEAVKIQTSNRFETLSEPPCCKSHKVRKMINVKHRISKEPLPLIFIDLEPQSKNKDIFNLEFLERRKNSMVQSTRCQDYDHSKTYCTKPFNCVKCSGPHDTQSCRKPRDTRTSAKCVLCSGSHTANYKGYTVYRDLINSRNKDNPKRIQNTPLQATNNVRQHVSYSQVAFEKPVIQQTNNNTADISGQLTVFLNEFKNMFNQLLNQNTMILSMLSAVINK
jgi:hypothetical protein